MAFTLSPKIILISFLASCCDASSAIDYNSYSEKHNVRTYSFSHKKLEEEFYVHQEDPSSNETETVNLFCFDYPNTNLPRTIVSPTFTNYLKSLSEIEYEVSIKPLLRYAVYVPLLHCHHRHKCNNGVYLQGEQITTSLFISNVKKILDRLLSILKKSSYLEIFLWEEKYLWYNLYWSLNTYNDVEPIITYEKDFNSMFGMCFSGINAATIFSVYDLLKTMLNEGSTNEEMVLLDHIAKPWLKCIEHSYNESLVVLTDLQHSWYSNFLRNVTFYRKTSIMMEYMVNSIQNTFYDFITPYTIKTNIETANAEWESKPLFYGLYLAVFLEPHVNQLKQIYNDRYLFQKDAKFAHLTLDITIFNESVPVNPKEDNPYLRTLSYSKKDDDIVRLSEFVIFTSDYILQGGIPAHFSLFRRYPSLHFDYSFEGLINLNNDSLLHSEPKNSPERLKKVAKWYEEIKSYQDTEDWTEKSHTLPKVIKHIKQNYKIKENADIDHLRLIAPHAEETKRLLRVVYRAAIGHRPTRYDMGYLGGYYNSFEGNNTIVSGSPLAHHLLDLINLYYHLRHIRPYEYFARLKNTASFMKIAYDLQNFRLFSYFQTYMILYLQSIISILTDVNFKYTNTPNATAIIKININQLKCEVKVNENDLVSLLINLRTSLGGRKLMDRYMGESAIIYHMFMKSMVSQSFDHPALEIVYWRYKEMNCIDIFSAPPAKLYTLLNDPYFRLYAFIQDPIVFAKVVQDLLIQNTYYYSSIEPMYFM